MGYSESFLRHTSFLYISSTGLIGLHFHKDVSKNHAFITAKIFMDVVLRHSFCTIVTKFGKVDLNLTEVQIIPEAANGSQKSAGVNSQSDWYTPSTKTVKTDRSTNIVRYNLI